jgi:lysophospholipase L1-like esterase
MQKTKSVLQNIVFLLVIIIICFILAEGILQAVENLGQEGLIFEGENLHIESDNIYLQYTLNPNATLKKGNVTYTVNKDGYRDEIYTLAKPKNTFRIIVLGDSITFGSLVQENDRYTEVLESALNEYSTGLNYEVINFGVSGYSPTNEVAFLEEIGLDYEPDLIIIGYALNDAVSRDNVEGEFSDCRLNLLNIPVPCKFKKILSSSVLLQNLRTILSNDENQKDIYIQYHEDEQRWDYVMEQYSLLQSHARSEKIPVVVAIFPILSDLDDYQWIEVHNKIEQDFSGLGFFVVDILDSYVTYNSTSLRATETDPWHPNALGHDRAAHAIYTKLINERIVN